jgi:hypothetical protein
LLFALVLGKKTFFLENQGTLRDVRFFLVLDARHFLPQGKNEKREEVKGRGREV